MILVRSPFDGIIIYFTRYGVDANMCENLYAVSKVLRQFIGDSSAIHRQVAAKRVERLHKFAKFVC